ncbi:MAG: hypothetical protein K6D97_00685 [Clostridia bacterium]|nr:hypothetical protein [Clostridia bacterium]
MEDFKNNITKNYLKKCELNIDGNENVFRGHIPDISDDFENIFAEWLSSKLGKNYNIYVDFTMNLGRKPSKKDENKDQANNRRPDIVITKKEKDKEYIKGVIELKANLGYVREGAGNLKKSTEEYVDIINKMEEISISYMRQEKYALKKKLVDKSDKRIEKVKERINGGKDKSIQIKRTIYRKEKIEYLVVALTSSNISKDNFDKYKDVFNKKEKKLAVLFDGWYYGLKDRKEDIAVVNDYVKRIKK